MSPFVIHIETLGCKLNQIESESIAAGLISGGFAVDMKPFTAERAKDARFLFSIINTCTVTGKAEQKARRLIRLLQHSCPAAAVLVTGCYAEVEQEAVAALGANVIVVPGSLKHFFAGLPRYLAENGVSGATPPEQAAALLAKWQPPRLVITGGKQTEADRFVFMTDSFEAHSRASLKIQDGCSGSCTYCRIRLARGKPASLEPATALERVLQLEKSGQREIVLTGVNLSLYRPAGSQTAVRDFADLLSFLLENTRSAAFRISSLHPEHVDEKLAAVLAHTRVLPHFHLSVQSGSDAVLQAMSRPYTAQTVRSAVALLRRVKENPFLACDMITGFPGETAADFAQTAALCRDCGFAGIHAFPFSPRPGTPACSMQNQLPREIAVLRAEELTRIAAENKSRYVAGLIGKTVAAIIEKKRTGSVRAVTEQYLHVAVRMDPAEGAKLGGQEVRLRLTAARPLSGKAEETEADAELAE